MRRYSVRSRILFGVTAWLLGAATATTGSLLTVSLLGQGITGNSAQLLTQDAVNKALANEAAQGPGAGAQSASPAVTTVGASSRSQPAATASPAATSKSPAPATTAAASPSSSPAPTSAPPPPSSGGAVLTSAGGEVVATCQGADAYLVSWSPLQGYQVGDVIRGPALTARVTFESHAGRVTMMVSCSAGVPSATSRGWVGDE